MDTEEIKEIEAVIRRVIKESQQTDEVWKWATVARKKDEDNQKMWQTIKTSALGHGVWVIAVFTGVAIWEYVRRMVAK